MSGRDVPDYPPKPLSLVGGELDEHFGKPVFKSLQRINSYYKDQLYKLLEVIEEEEDEDKAY